MGKKTSSNKAKNAFYISLLSALVGVGLIGAAVHFGANNHFLASVFLSGGSLADYLYALAIVISFVLGVLLVGLHVAREGVAEHFYEQTPY